MSTSRPAPERSSRAATGARRVIPALLGALTIVLATAAPAAAENVSANQWARSVCRAVSDWNDGVDETIALADFDPAGDASVAKTTILKIFKRVRTDTRALLADVEDAGTPSVSDGKQVATAVRTSYEDVLTAVAAGRTVVKATPTENPAAFALTADSAFATLTASIVAVADGFEASGVLNTAALSKAFRKQSACRELT